MPTNSTDLRRLPKLPIESSKKTLLNGPDGDFIPVTIGVYVTNQGDKAWKIDGPEGTVRYYGDRGTIWAYGEQYDAPKFKELRKEYGGKRTKGAKAAATELQYLLAGMIG